MSDLYASPTFAARIRALRESIRAGTCQGEANSSPPITFHRVETSVTESNRCQSSDTLELNLQSESAYTLPHEAEPAASNHSNLARVAPEARPGDSGLGTNGANSSTSSRGEVTGGGPR